ncbi:TonB-linked SusC/RagA family outer membrane protein [Pedobacter sp. AK017]|uniref:SusC/RagA family TonB-linked outer membrane protein n=1 Tax=Pedobacter sp. AK017 TaxID=2723073 RepID=UPI0016179E50|nr:TonB-dependent receptor [Pedobacter sp. AK017]MBB5438355.1 TonB-linked SusC/RagA family outer membrane protein [Pedobacter sp. AK017]
MMCIRFINEHERKILFSFFLLLNYAFPAFPQSAITVQGKITGAKGEALSQVTVVVKGTKASTSTNPDGNYAIQVPGNNAVLVFSSMGFLKQEVPVNGRKLINIELMQDVKALEDVVVIGYGVARKSDLTGSVSSIKAEDLKKTQVTSFDQALQGRAAGVQVTQISGKPGAETSIRIRGTSSINAGNEPLYVIDGMLVSSDGADMSTGATRGPRISPLSSINPSDIESIEILKDASATAIYGSRGANGVVLITTKRGRTGAGIVTFESYYGIQEISHKVEVLDAEQFANLVNEAKLNSNATPIYVNPKNLGMGTDWQDELLRTAPMASYQLSFSGGDEKTKYAVSGGYFTQKGIILNSDFKRYAFRANMDREVSSRLTIGNSLSFSRIASTGVLTNSGTIVPGVTSSALLFNPVLPVYDASVAGGYTFENDRGKTLGNPIAEAKEYNSYSTIARLLGNVYAKYKIVEGLDFKTSFGIDQFTSKENAFGPNFLKRTQASKGEASVGDISGLTWLNENTLTYHKTIKEDHVFDILGGFTMQRFNNESLFAYAFDFPDNLTGYHNLGTALNPQKTTNNESQWSLISYLGRINYSLKNKYLFTATGRIDGSSKFAEGKKYGFFPSGAFAWKVVEEDFMKTVKQLSDLKLRVSYGLIGNQNIAPYQSLALVGPYGEGVFNGSEIYTGREPLTYVNKNLKWESTRQFDIGMDVAFFENRIALTADYYHKKTNDLLLSSPIPLTSGFTSTLLNIGNIVNRGFDFDLRTVNTTGALKWNSSVNFSINRNEITSLANKNADILSSGSLLRVGQPVGTFYGYIFEGIFQSDAEAAGSPVLKGQEANSANVASRAKAGDRKYRDINKDGVIDEGDRTIIGSAQPDFTWGFNNTLSFKNIDLSFFFQGSQGNKMANLNSYDLLNFNGQTNVLKEGGLNRWTPENHSNKYPRAVSEGSLDQGVFSTAIVEDASYIRLRNVTLAYNLPKSWVQKIKLNNVRVYASATNLWTHTKYSGYDPEANTFGQNSFVIGYDQGGYPIAKTYSLGINVGF